VGRDRVKPRPPLFRALGAKEPPARVRVAGEDYVQLAVFKHDSWAATALYGNGERRITCKFNRMQPVFLLPMGWLGRLLARREAWFLDALKELELVPDGLGPVVVDGQVARHAVARIYVEGEPFRDRTGLAPDFIRQLENLLGEVHRRGIAYVDLHKRENVIVDRQGRPNLIDFQVSLATGDRFPFNTRAFGWLVRQLQETDLYHVRKHHVRLYKEEFTPEERESYARPPGIIGAHRRVAVPLRRFRRMLLTKLRVRDRSGMAGSEHEPEVAFRTPDPAPGTASPADRP
jgi:hypothetical protein